MSSPRTGLEGEIYSCCHDTGWVRGKLDPATQKYEFTPCTCVLGQMHPHGEARQGATRKEANAGNWA